MRSRDTADAVTQSNWTAQLESLGGESDTVEIHRFGHWGPGWIEIVLVHPDREREVEEIEGALADYPVLDDMALSALESEHAASEWGRSRGGWWCVVDALHLSDAASDLLCDSAAARDAALTNVVCGGEGEGSLYEHGTEGCAFYVDRIADSFDRDEIAGFIRLARTEARAQREAGAL